eukprot:GHVT01076325.1.p2 GENE.GHVT01076325.1~~GHVT01076325.1.p2  ORF type:complete len:192 (-),score=18.00 GHVT01076325.1:174-749(-)
MGVHIHKLSHEPPKASEIATTRESVSLCENTGTVNNARKVKTKANAVPAIVLFWYHLGDRMSLPKIAAAGSATNIGARRLKGSRVSAKNPTTILKKRIPGSPRLANLNGLTKAATLASTAMAVMHARVASVAGDKSMSTPITTCMLFLATKGGMKRPNSRSRMKHTVTDSQTASTVLKCIVASDARVDARD